jgi:intracellular sulfur oxidation DsrE/DsrF family protein
MNTFLKTACLVITLATSVGVAAQSPRINPTGGGALYIAGDGFSLEQAVADGIRENGGKTEFRVLVLGAEISKLGFHGATREVTSVIGEATRNLGRFYVCERDMKRQSFSPSDFLPGVEVVRGLTAKEAGVSGGANAEKSKAPLAPLPRMRRICAE